MGDLTPLFKKCVQIIDDEIARDPNFKRPVAKDPIVTNSKGLD